MYTTVRHNGDIMKAAINDAKELVRFFDRWIYTTTPMRKEIAQGVYVNSQIRRELLTSEDQGVIRIEAKHYQIQFEDMKGGVWRAHIPELKEMVQPKETW